MWSWESEMDGNLSNISWFDSNTRPSQQPPKTPTHPPTHSCLRVGCGLRSMVAKFYRHVTVCDLCVKVILESLNVRFSQYMSSDCFKIRVQNVDSNQTIITCLYYMIKVCINGTSEKKTKNDHSPVGYRVLQGNTLIFCRRTCFFFYWIW